MAEVGGPLSGVQRNLTGHHAFRTRSNERINRNAKTISITAQRPHKRHQSDLLPKVYQPHRHAAYIVEVKEVGRACVRSSFFNTLSIRNSNVQRK